MLAIDIRRYSNWPRGLTGAPSPNCSGPANEQVLKSLSYAYAHRKDKKSDFRKLWIARINAAARLNGISYSRLMFGLKEAGVDINRKMLADLAVNDMSRLRQAGGTWPGRDLGG